MQGSYCLQNNDFFGGWVGGWKVVEEEEHAGRI